MAINRFSQRRVYDQFNPLSIQELAMVPLAKQQQHDSQLAAALQQKAQANALAADTPDRDRLVAEVDDKINSFTSELMNKGLQHNSTKNLLDLKQYRDQLMSPQGDLGKIEANAAAYRAFDDGQKELVKEWYKSGGKKGLSPDAYRDNQRASLATYKGYKNSSFQGYEGIGDPGIADMALEYAKTIDKNELASTTGWKFVDNFQGSGQGVWVKGSQTSKTTPPDVNKAIEAYVLSQPQVQKYMQDQAYFDEVLGRHQKDDMGNIVYGDMTYNPNDPNARYQASQSKLQDEIRSKVSPAVFQAYSGQGTSYDQDIRMATIDNNNSGNKPNKYGISIVGDLGATPSFLQGKSASEIAQIAEDFTVSGDLANAEKAERHLNRAKELFEENLNKTEAGKKLLKNLPKAETMKELDRSRKALAVMLKNGEIGIDEYHTEMTELANTVDSSTIEYFNKLNIFLESGMIAEGTSLKLGFDNDDKAKELASMLKRNLDGINFDIVGKKDDEEIAVIEKIKNSYDIQFEQLDLHGETSKPSLRVKFRQSKDVPYETVDVQLNSLGHTGLPNSSETFVDVLTEGTDFNNEARGQIAYYDIAIGETNNLLKLPNLQKSPLSKEYTSVNIIEKDGVYNIKGTSADGTEEFVMNSDGIEPNKFNSKTEAITYLLSLQTSK